MKKEIEFELTKAAEKSGGDRYEAEAERGSFGTRMVIYIPQYISRGDGEVPYPSVKVTIEA